MNVGTTGSVKGATIPAGICRAVRENGRVVNCWSSCSVAGVEEASGIARSNYNVVANCIFTGDLSGAGVHPTCHVQEGGKVYNNYAVGEEHYTVGGETIVTEDELSSDELIGLLNDGRTKAADMAGIAESLLCGWEVSSDSVPVLVAQ